METLVVITISMAMALGCFALGFSFLVMKTETTRAVSVQSAMDTEEL